MSYEIFYGFVNIQVINYKREDFDNFINYIHIIK